MSALFTALVESETKETLAASLLEHRKALRKVMAELRRFRGVNGAVLDEGEKTLRSMGFREAGNKSRCEVVRVVHTQEAMDKLVTCTVCTSLALCHAHPDGCSGQSTRCERPHAEQGVSIYDPKAA